MSEYVFTKDELAHHGIKGQKWGIRKYQNPDGTLTPEGRERYGVNSKQEWKDKKKEMRTRRDALEREAHTKYNMSDKELAKDMEDAYNEKVKRDVEWWYGEGSTDRFSDNANYYAQKEYEEKKQTRANEEYDRAVAEAEEWIENSMKEEFGRSYDTWQEEATTKAAVGLGAAVVAEMIAAGALMYWAFKN